MEHNIDSARLKEAALAAICKADKSDAPKPQPRPPSTVYADVAIFANKLLAAVGELSIDAEHDTKGIDIARSVALTMKARAMLGYDSIVLIVAAEDTPQHIHRLSAATHPAMGGYTDIGSGKKVVGMLVGCAQAADLMMLIMARDELSGFRDGIRMMAYHELAHAKLDAISLGHWVCTDSMRWGTGDGHLPKEIRGAETIAQLTALSRLEGRGRRDRAIDAMAQYLAISYYLTPRDGMAADAEEGSFVHWRDQPWFERLGLTEKDYMAKDGPAQQEAVSAAQVHFRRLCGLLGPPYRFTDEEYAASMARAELKMSHAAAVAVPGELRKAGYL